MYLSAFPARTRVLFILYLLLRILKEPLFQKDEHQGGVLLQLGAIHHELLVIALR
jgi:hypothetical protein